MTLKNNNHKPYPKYKSSGVEWIGDIPESWTVWKTKHAFKIISSGTTPSSEKLEYYDGNIPWVTTGELRETQINDTKEKLTKKAIEDYPSLKIYQIDTLLIAMYGATIGRLGILGVPACVNQACCAFAKPKHLNTKFVYYWFMFTRNYIIGMSYGGGQPNINQNLLKNITILAPDLKEQRLIADYLDYYTSLIDEAISKQGRLIELLEEKRIAIINSAVTKGLDPSVKMKPSGIEWIGDIPETWAVKKLKRTTNNINEKGSNDSLPFVGLEHIVSGVGKFIDLFDYEKKLSNDYPIFYPDDILFGKLRPYLRKYLKANMKGCCSTDILIIRANRQYWLEKYLFYLIQSEAFISLSIATSYGTKMPRSSWEKLGVFDVCIPPLSEQRTIADYLDCQTSFIDDAISKSKTLVETLREKRTALISAVVTGKIDVRNETCQIGGL